MSSIFNTLRDLWRVRLTISQVALSFLLAALNWAVITIWASSNLTKLFQGTWLLDVWFWVSIAMIFFFPVGLSVIGSVASPERITISPFDINGLTIGIFTVTLWLNIIRFYSTLELIILYFFSLFVTVFALFTFSIGQNFLTHRLIGIEGSEQELRWRIFWTKLPKNEVADTISSDAKRNAIGLLYRDQLDDGTVCFYGRPDDVELHLAVSEAAKGSIISVLAFVIGAVGIRPIDELWFKAREAGILAVLSELDLKPDKKSVLARSVVEHVLSPTRGLLHRFQEVWTGLLRHIIITIMLGSADYFVWFSKIISQDSAIQLGFFIALYAVGVPIISRRKWFR